MALFWRSFHRLELHCKRCLCQMRCYLTLGAKGHPRGLFSLKPEFRDEVFSQMMVDTGNKETLIVLENPGDKEFIESFLHGGVKHVLCYYTNKADYEMMCSKMNFTGQFSAIHTLTHKPKFEHLKDLKIQDLNVRYLLSRINFSRKLAYLSTELSREERELYFNVETGANPAHSSWYYFMWPDLFKIFYDQSKKCKRLPCQNSTTKLGQYKTWDFNLTNKPEKKENKDDIIFLKREPEYGIYKQLPTDHMRSHFNAFCKLKNNTEMYYRITPVLHELFPGSVQALSDHGFYINTIIGDMDLYDLLQVYLILIKLPGFEESNLHYRINSEMENRDFAKRDVKKKRSRDL